MKQAAETSWAIAEAPEPTGGEGRSHEDHEKRVELARQVAAIGESQGWTKADVARRIGMPDGTFSQWFSGKYPGRIDTQNAKVLAWLSTFEEAQEVAKAIPASPGFIETTVAREITELLVAAMVMPTMVMATAAPGMGKTTTADKFAATRANVFLATVSPHTRTVHGMLTEIADAIGVNQPNPGKLVRSIGQRLRRTGAGTLLIVDEAQNLVDDAINQLRHFTDLYRCGVALLSSTETYTRFASWATAAKYGQLHRRIYKRMRRELPDKGDLKKFISAWGVQDPAMVEFLTGVGMKPGAFGQIDMTIKLAKLQAVGNGEPLRIDHLKRAWANRDVEIRQ